MTNLLDRATETEMLQRDEALAKAKMRSQEPQQLISDGDVLCIDCEVPIQTARLRAKPNASRCIYCQGRWEKRHG